MLYNLPSVFLEVIHEERKIMVNIQNSLLQATVIPRWAKPESFYDNRVNS